MHLSEALRPSYPRTCPVVLPPWDETWFSLDTHRCISKPRVKELSVQHHTSPSTLARVSAPSQCPQYPTRKGGKPAKALGRGDAHSQSENNRVVHGLFTQTRPQSRHMGIMPHSVVLNNPLSHIVTPPPLNQEWAHVARVICSELLHVNTGSLCSFHPHSRSQRLGASDPQAFVSSWGNY